MCLHFVRVAGSPFDEISGCGVPALCQLTNKI